MVPQISAYQQYIVVRLRDYKGLAELKERIATYCKVNYQWHVLENTPLDVHLKYYRHAYHLKDEVSNTILVHTPLAFTVNILRIYLDLFTFFKCIVWCYNLLDIYNIEVLNFKVPQGTLPSLQQIDFSSPFHHFLPSNNNLIGVLLHLLGGIASLRLLYIYEIW